MTQNYPKKLTAIHSPFTTFCEGPDDVERGYRLFSLFYKRNYAQKIPKDRDSEILVVSSGVGYFQHFLEQRGYSHVTGVDSDHYKVEYAQKKGFSCVCADCFDFLAELENRYDLIFVEQEVNHLTRDELLVFLKMCFKALKTGGMLILSAANCANPLISSEYFGNNIDHYTSFTENSIRQYFSLTDFKEVKVFPHDFYVIWNNPLNYIAKLVTACLHFSFRMVFKMYGKSNKIFTKRLGALAIK